MNEKKPSLSLCMIVKDEENFIEGCLQSVADFVDQIIIIDTGSSDNTLEIAKRYDAEIYKFNWCDDFSKARNESIKYADGDWILWLDADERLNIDSSDQLLSELTIEDHPVIYQVQINNQTTDQASAYLSSAYRLFSNNFGIHFTGRIHEQLAKNTIYGEVEVRRSKIRLEHLGYALAGTQKEKKNSRNLKLLNKMVLENPNNAYAHYTLGQQLSLVNKKEKALKHFEKALNLNQFDKPMTASLLNVLSENYFGSAKYREAKASAEESASIIKEQVSAYYMLYRIAEKTGEYDEAINAVNQMRKYVKVIEKNGFEISTDVTIDDDKLIYTLGILEEKRGSLPAAFERFVNVLNKREDEEVYNKAIQLAFKIGKINKAEILLRELINFNPNRIDAIDTLGTVLIKLQKFNKAIEIYETLHNKVPKNDQVVRRLAGLYLKTGKDQKAAALMA